MDWLVTLSHEVVSIMYWIYSSPQLRYIKAVHGFRDENITILMDDGDHIPPTRHNIMAAYRKIVGESEAGDAIFLHYSGHGGTVKDTSGDEASGYDETLVPVDYLENGMIIDDDLHEIIVNRMPEGVVCFSLVCYLLSLNRRFV